MVNKKLLTAYQRSIRLAVVNKSSDAAHRWVAAMQDLKEGYKKI